MPTAILKTQDIESLADHYANLATEPEALREARRDNYEDQLRYKQLKFDQEYELEFGIPGVLAVDFSEIFCYLHPTGDPTTGRTVEPIEALQAQYAFESAELLILPPAAMYELLDHLQYLARRLTFSEAHARQEHVGFLTSRLAEEAAHALRSAAERDHGRLQAVMRRVSRSWPELAEFARSLLDPAATEMLRRLSVLLEKVMAGDATLDVEDIAIDHSVYERTFGVLNEKRPLKARQNYYDAINIGFIAHMNSLSQDRALGVPGRCHMLFLTRGLLLAPETTSLAHVSDIFLGTRNPVVTGYNRDLKYAALRTALDRMVHGTLDRQSIIAQQIEQYFFADRVLDSLRIAVTDRPGLEIDGEIVIEKAGASLFELAALARAVEPLLMDVDPSLRRLIPIAVTQTDQSEGMDPDEVALARLLETSTDDVISRARVYSESIARFTQWIDQQSAKMSAAGLDLTNVSRRPHLTTFIVRPLRDGGEYDWEVRGSPGSYALARILLQADSYTVVCDYYPGRMYWFCQVARHVVVVAAGHDAPLPLRRVEKVFDGIEVISVSGGLWVSAPLSPDLDELRKPDQLFAEAQGALQDLPSLFRVGVPYMDLWYHYFQPNEAAGRVGLVSHLGLGDVVGQFVRHCHQDVDIGDELEGVLDEFLSERYPPRDGNEANV